MDWIEERLRAERRVLTSLLEDTEDRSEKVIEDSEGMVSETLVAPELNLRLSYASRFRRDCFADCDRVLCVTDEAMLLLMLLREGDGHFSFIADRTVELEAGLGVVGVFVLLHEEEVYENVLEGRNM